MRPGETWTGTYVCPQGETQLALRVRRVDGYDIEATFGFVHAASGASGQYALRGKYTPGTRLLRFAAGEWITRPPATSRWISRGTSAPTAGSSPARSTRPGAGTSPFRGRDYCHPASAVHQSVVHPVGSAGPNEEYEGRSTERRAVASPAGVSTAAADEAPG